MREKVKVRQSESERYSGFTQFYIDGQDEKSYEAKRDPSFRQKNKNIDMKYRSDFEFVSLEWQIKS